MNRLVVSGVLTFTLAGAVMPVTPPPFSGLF